ncbi:unnamed protein product (macronuclear) [Paramecium tetraurelia]|uniref:TNFR-Cys domain-containing protein n=1 Tax=Paramecium tetraurelia TaxID=5888 RepID=A0CZG3_PARTE|nr:uncharacterized protein GSPATT00011753001 [Paramecium tetraurelia]CAK76180.1 unnamed protein product [Paramecium tetraurelia]|eukprot:XP_001443577.1 hypothetical protein (macronuclear) [Paramecium tetraurelia strain d4-2]
MILFILLTFNKKRTPPGFLNFQIFIGLILQNQIFQLTMAQTEISRSFFSPISSDDNWKTYLAESSPYITDCGSSYIFGGLSVFTYYTTITKTFILPPHYKLKLEFKFWRLTSWFGSPYIFYIDGSKSHDDNPNTSTGTQICGVGTQGQVYQISKEIAHNGNSAIATLISQQTGSYWGISDFILYVQKCPKGCDYCDITGNCLNWNRVLAFFNQILVTGGQGWERDYFLYDGTAECGSFQFYGPFQMSEKISIDLNLPDPHTKYRIQFKFLCTYVTGGITIRVEGNGVQLTNFAYPLNIITTTNIICGSYLKLDKIDLGEFASSASILTITLEISAFSTVSSSTPLFGIRDFEVFTDAEKKQVLDGSIICSDNNIYAFDGCFSYIYDCNEGCNNCVKGLCIQCLSPWVLNTISGQCVPKCGDQIVVSSEQCDDGNQQPYDGCYECQFSCPLNCMVCQYGKCLICNYSYQLIDNKCQFTCVEDEKLSQYQDNNNEGHYCQISNFLINPYLQHVRLNTDIQFQYDSDLCKINSYGIFGYLYDMCPFEIPRNCKIGFLNQCQICQDEYDLSNNNYCIPKCGNGIIQEYEQCDDLNLEQFDGCYQCNSSCQLECLECYYSQCFECIEGWDLINFKCVSECGDGKIALLSDEQCDDQNNKSNDGCFQCKFECTQNCLFCNHNLDCILCQKYFEIQNNICVPICGDGITIEGFEQCDDGNDIEFDGCYQCQFSCKQNCQTCDQYQCLDLRENQCQNGYQLIDDQCHSICGDLIIASDEQCDDANEIPFDGCYQCKYSCSFNCLDCMDGQCIKCDDGYEIINNICLDICGNGIKSEKEECDDKNLISQDGCSDECKIEINWTCSQIDLETSICLLMKPPHFNLLLINQTYESFFIQMQITSQVKLLDSYSNLTQSLQLSLIDIDPTHYIIYEYVLVEPNVISVQDINYLFQIKFLKQETMEIYFQVSFDTELIDQYGFSVENQYCKLHLRNPIVLSEIERTVSHKMSSLNMYMLIGLGVSSFIILLSGNPVECFEVLDTLQYQSNLKYINSNYPENVMIYFESSEVVTIVPVLEKLQFLDLFNVVIGQEKIQAFEKFLFYDVNAELISNLSGLIAQIVIVVLLLIASKIYFWIFIKKCYNQFRIFIYNSNKLQFTKQIALIIHKLNQLSIRINQLISLNGIVYIIQANSWDLIFKTLLYLYSQKENTFRNQFQNILACSFLICILVLLSSIFSIKDSQMGLKKRKSILHEGLIVAKKFFFLLVLIGFQKSSLTQSVLLSLINTFYITIIILGQIVSENIDLILILMFEVPVILFTLLNIAYEQSYANFLSYESQIVIGFGQIGLLSFGILAPLIKYVHQIKIKLHKQIQKWIQQKEKEKQPPTSLFL